MEKNTLLTEEKTSSKKTILRGEAGTHELTFVKKTREILDGFLHHFDRIEQIFTKLIPQKNYQLIITNISVNNHEPHREYGLILDTDSILYAEKNQKNINRYQFSIKTFSMQYNGQPTRIDALSELIRKIQWVLADLENHQAIVYEYKTHRTA
jgi:hypothetical protein